MNNGLTDWLFRAIMFEADAERFRGAGLRVGADTEEAEVQLLEETLAPFPLKLRNEAMRMARLYASIYCFEGSIRQFIQDRLEENCGPDWWEKAVPKKVKEQIEDRQSKALANSWLEGNTGSRLSFSQFGHLADIIIARWEDFSDQIPSQHWLKQRFDELEQARNFIAHNRYLLPSEFRRIELYLADWDRQIGF